MSLASILELVCDTCEKTFHIKSSPQISSSAEINQRYSVNVGAVWGQMSIGGGQKRLNETLATLNVLWRTMFCGGRCFVEDESMEDRYWTVEYKCPLLFCP